MSIDSDQLQESIRLAKARAEQLQFSFSAESNLKDRVQCIWLERDGFFCEIFIFLDSEFVDFSILSDGDQLEFDGPLDQSVTVSEKVSVILKYLERTVVENQT